MTLEKHDLGEAIVFSLQSGKSYWVITKQPGVHHSTVKIITMGVMISAYFAAARPGHTAVTESIMSSSMLRYSIVKYEGQLSNSLIMAKTGKPSCGKQSRQLPVLSGAVVPTSSPQGQTVYCSEIFENK